MNMQTTALVMDCPGQLSLRSVQLESSDDSACVIDIERTSISAGTERLLWKGEMPMFPGMGYPLVPGYEAIGRVRSVGADSALSPGQLVFVPGCSAYSDVRGLFGAAAKKLIVNEQSVYPLQEQYQQEGLLMALAATACNIVRQGGADRLPDLIVGHGVLGRLCARLAVALGARDLTVWETSDRRRDDARGYSVIHPDADDRGQYRCICDVSGDATLMDTLISSLSTGGLLVLGGFYSERLSFAFPPAFIKGLELRVAAEWRPDDMKKIASMVNAGMLPLDGLITHSAPVSDAVVAYAQAFDDPDCLKMMIDWR